MGKERMYTLSIDKAERGAIILSLKQKRDELAADDLPADVINGILARMDSLPVKRGLFGLRTQKLELKLDSDERRCVIKALNERRSDLLHDGKDTEVYSEALVKVFDAKTERVTADETR